MFWINPWRINRDHQHSCGFYQYVQLKKIIDVKIHKKKVDNERGSSSNNNNKLKGRQTLQQKNGDLQIGLWKLYVNSESTHKAWRRFYTNPSMIFWRYRLLEKRGKKERNGEGKWMQQNNEENRWLFKRSFKQHFLLLWINLLASLHEFCRERDRMLTVCS